jgi:D-glycero-beta-D-manno-heptose 1-phosphate adenylyltransferase
LTLEEMLELRHGKKLVFTNGVFDILHAGHVQYLAAAKEMGELLVVGLNSDISARALGKGPNRPVNSEEDRSTVLRALRSVDAVIIFDEPTPERLIRALRPQVHVKGGDYTPDDLPESAAVREYGGEVRIIPFLEGRSTTGVLQRLNNEG